MSSSHPNGTRVEPAALWDRTIEPAGSDQLQGQLIALLKISPSLTSRGRTTDLRHAYLRYKGVYQAQTDLNRLVSEKIWTHPTTLDQIITIFVSKTAWYDYYAKLFPLVKDGSPLMKWLENGDEAPRGVDVFGVEKPQYMFKDLRALIDTSGRKRKSKKDSEGGKGKKKAKKSRSVDNE